MRLITTFHCDGCSKVASTERSEFYQGSKLPKGWGVLSARTASWGNVQAKDLVPSSMLCLECIPGAMAKLAGMVETGQHYIFEVETVSR